MNILNYYGIEFPVSLTILLSCGIITKGFQTSKCPAYWHIWPYIWVFMIIIKLSTLPEWPHRQSDCGRRLHRLSVRIGNYARGAKGVLPMRGGVCDQSIGLYLDCL